MYVSNICQSQTKFYYHYFQDILIQIQFSFYIQYTQNDLFTVFIYFKFRAFQFYNNYFQQLKESRPMSLFKRIGTERHKYQLEFYIKKISFSKSLKGSVYVTIKRGDHKVTTQQQVPFQDKVCNFNNQKLVFPALTLFYDQSEQKYQQKTGQLKVILKSNKGEKKLLGVANFDVANYANDKSKKSFKEKLELNDTPKSLEGIISFQVFIEYMGEASQRSRSIVNQQKHTHRDQSPLDKIANTLKGFFGSDERQQNSKNKAYSPTREQEPQRELVKVSRKQKNKNEQSNETNNRNQQQIKHKSSRRKNIKQQQDNGQQNNKKQKSRRQNIKQTQSDQQAEIFNYKKKPSRKNQIINKKQNRVKEKKLEREIENENENEVQNQQGSDGVEEEFKIVPKNEKERTKKSDQIEKNEKKKGKNSDQQHFKNYIHPKYPESMTELGQQDAAKSSHFKSEAKMNEPEKRDFFFDDPDTFPDTFRKKQSDNIVKEMIKRDKVERVSNPKPPKKVKQNTLHMDSKKSKESQKNKSQIKIQARNYMFEDPKVNNEETYKSKSDKKIDKQQKQMLFSEFAPPNTKQTYISPFQLSRKTPNNFVEPTSQSKIGIRINELNDRKLQQLQKTSKVQTQNLRKQLDKKVVQLQNKGRQLQRYKARNENVEDLKSKLKQSQQTKNNIEKSYNELKESLAKAEKEISRLRYQNQNLKNQVDKSQSFFRQTQQYYAENNQTDSKEEIKRLEKQKNQHLLTLLKEREKNKKQVKQLTQQIQKAKEKFKQYQDLSKAELKKLKDEVLSKNGNIQNLKDKLKQKSKEQQALLKESNSLNSKNIDLKQKLQSLKLKICEKLNEANQSGQSYVMEVLTELNEQF